MTCMAMASLRSGFIFSSSVMDVSVLFRVDGGEWVDSGFDLENGLRSAVFDEVLGKEVREVGEEDGLCGIVLGLGADVVSWVGGLDGGC